MKCKKSNIEVFSDIDYIFENSMTNFRSYTVFQAIYYNHHNIVLLHLCVNSIIDQWSYSYIIYKVSPHYPDPTRWSCTTCLRWSTRQARIITILLMTPSVFRQSEGFIAPRLIRNGVLRQAGEKWIHIWYLRCGVIYQEIHTARARWKVDKNKK